MGNKFFSGFRKTFVTGLLIILPLAVTVFFLKIVFIQFHSRVTPVVTHILKILGFPYLDTKLFNLLAPIISFATIVILISLLGVFATNYLGRKLVLAIDRLMLKIPLVKGIYGAAKQLLDAIQAPGSKSFQEVVFVEYPRKGLFVIGFLGTDVKGELTALSDKGLVNVFIPTTPNPTSGFLLLIPKDQIIHVDMPIDAALKYIVSGGLVARPFSILDGKKSEKNN